MKLISWNVNGLRACIQKGFLEEFSRLDADFFCLQETKLQEGQLQLDLPGYHQYWCYAEKKGYSGTAIFTKYLPQTVTYGLGIPELDTEGRVITLAYPEFYLVNCYTPNAQQGLVRLDHRLKWEAAFREHLSSLDAKKPVILCGDLNVAHQEIDLKNPAANRESAGFSDQEREAFGKLLDCGFTDTFRYLNPTATGCYSWWSYRFNARQNNAGWRIDYFLVSDRLKEAVYKAPIYSSILGSDHCPVGLELDITCNGSIWKEKADGKPQVISQVPTRAPRKTNTALQAGIAAGLLAIGFAMGHFLPPLFSPKPTDPNATVSTSPSGNGNLGIMVDYASMSTQTLVNLAVDIPELADYGDFISSSIVPVLTEELYAQLQEKYPVLYELEQRPDLQSSFLSFATTPSTQDRLNAAISLMSYYTRIGLFSNSDIAQDYASMSTQELAKLASMIPELATYYSSITDSMNILTKERYDELCRQYPVLLELERRNDAVDQLYRLLTQSYNTQEAVRAITVLIEYYQDLPETNAYYASLSTRELVNIAVNIPELAALGAPTTSVIMTDRYYDMLAQVNPVLQELERRTDLKEQLSRVAMIDSGRPPLDSQMSTIYAASCLLGYYTRIGLIEGFDSVPPDPNVSWEDDRRIYQQDLSYTIYEYTHAPEYGFSGVTKPGSTLPMQTMTFESGPLILDNAPEWIRDSNFWMRVEVNNPQSIYLDLRKAELKINADSPDRYQDEIKLQITPYSDASGNTKGFMIFGIAQKAYSLRLNYEGGTTLMCRVTPTPPENTTTTELLEYAINNSNLMHYSENANGQDVCTYLPLKLLLEREDFFSTMLDIIYDGWILRKGTADSIYSSCDVLMRQDFLQDKIPRDIYHAHQRITSQDFLNYYLLNQPNIVLPNQHATQLSDYRIKAIPESLSDIPMEEWNFFVRIDLNNKAAMEHLPTDQWHLEFIPLENFQGAIGIVPYYTITGGEEPQGWLIFGKAPESRLLEIQLRHEDVVLQTVNARIGPEIIYG